MYYGGGGINGVCEGGVINSNHNMNNKIFLSKIRSFFSYFLKITKNLLCILYTRTHTDFNWNYYFSRQLTHLIVDSLIEFFQMFFN